MHDDFIQWIDAYQHVLILFKIIFVCSFKYSSTYLDSSFNFIEGMCRDSFYDILIDVTCRIHSAVKVNRIITIKLIKNIK